MIESYANFRNVNFPYSANHYQVVNPYAKYALQLTEIFEGQGAIIRGIWNERCYSPCKYEYFNSGRDVYNHFGIVTGHIPKLLCLFSDNRLKPIPDNIWYEIANYFYDICGSKEDCTLLRENAPQPVLVSDEVLKKFCKNVSMPIPKRGVAKDQQEGFAKATGNNNSNPPVALPVATKVEAKESQNEKELAAARQALLEQRNEIQRLKEELAKAQAAAAPQQPAPASNTDTDCSICMNAKLNAALNCGHLFCEPCAVTFINKACPTCRQLAERVQRIYLP